MTEGRVQSRSLPLHPGRKRMTRAKAERLVAALEAVTDCDDGPIDPAFERVRALVEPWMED